MMSDSFQVGAAETDITPHLGALLTGLFKRRPAEDVDDPLFSKAVVLDDGDTRLAMIVLDLIAIPLDIVQRIRTAVGEHVGIPPENIMVGCTHTHTAPQTRQGGREPRDEAYVDWLVQRVSDSVRLAVRRLQPARIAWGEGEQHDISFCRRYLMKDGTVHMNPRNREDIVKPTSPIDPSVGVLYIEDLDGNPITVITRFSLHYVGTENSNAISSDYYGDFAKVMRRHLGSHVIPLLFNGTSAQIISRDALDQSHSEESRSKRSMRIATGLAAEVMKVMTRLKPTSECKLDAALTAVSLPCKRVTEEDIEVAKQILDGNDPHPGKGPFSFIVGQPIAEARRLYYSRLVLSMPESINTEVQAFRIGDSGWVALPGEIFTETGFAIKADSPVPNTFVVSLANDSIGYIATDHAFTQEGGYETWGRAGVGSEDVLKESAARLLSRLFEKD